MKTEKKKSFMDRLRALMKDAEAEEKEKEKEEMEDEDVEKEEEGKEEEEKKTSDADILEQRLARIEAVINKLIPLEEAEHGKQLDGECEGKEDEEETVDTILEPEENDKVDTGTVLTGDAFKAVIARAEILYPGISIPTGDAAKDKRAVPRLQLKAVQHALTSDDGKAAVETFLMGRELKALTFDQLSMVFNGAAELLRAKNNTINLNQKTRDFGKSLTPEQINARNREFWAKR